MNVVRNAETVFVVALVVAFGAAFIDGATSADGVSEPVQTRRVAQLIAVPSVPVVIVRAKRMSAEEKSHVDPAPASPAAGARI